MVGASLEQNIQVEPEDENMDISLTKFPFLLPKITKDDVGVINSDQYKSP